MNVFDLVAKLTLDSSEYDHGLDDSERKASSFGNKLRSGVATAGKVTAAAVATATAAVGAFAAKAVDAGKTFDASMSQVAATMGDAADKIVNYNGEAMSSVDALREFAQEMGRTTAFSATEAADALNYMALAGYDAQQSMKMLPTVLDLAAAGNIDLASASDMVTDAQSALGLTAYATTSMVDQMAKASSKSNTSVAQLGEAILTIGATARGVAGGTVELSTVLGVLADNGIKGAEGGTHLRNMLLSLQTPTKDGTEALAKLGLTYADMYDSAGNMRAIPDIMIQLQQSMEGMTQASKDAIISGIFNKTDLAAVNALIGTSQERFDELTISIANSKGAAEEMASVQLDNLAGDITLFKSALEGAQIAVSDQLTPSLREFVQFGTKGLSQLTAAFQEGGLSGAMDAFGQILSDGLEMIISKLPEMVEAGMQLLDALIDGIISNLPALINAAVDIVKSLTEYIVRNLPKLIDAAVEIIFTIADGIIDALPDLIPAVVEIILTIVEKLTEPSTLMQLIDTALKLIGALAEGLIRAIPQLVAKVPTIILNLIEAILRFIPQVIASGTELIVNFALGIVQGGAELVRAVVEVISNAKESIMERVRDAYNWGRDLIQNFIDGILGKWYALRDTISSVAGTVRDFLGFSEPKKGPLSNFHTYAPDMMELFAKGIRDNEKLVSDQLNSSLSIPSNTFDYSGSFGTGNGGSINSYTGSPINITVYGAEGQDVQQLADILIDEITRRTEREQVAFA